MSSLNCNRSRERQIFSRWKFLQNFQVERSKKSNLMSISSTRAVYRIKFTLTFKIKKIIFMKAHFHTKVQVTHISCTLMYADDDFYVTEILKTICLLWVSRSSMFHLWLLARPYWIIKIYSTIDFLSILLL